MIISKLINNRRGYSLVEVMLVAGILSLVSLAGGVLLHQSIKQNTIQIKKSEDKSFVNFTLKPVSNLFMFMKHRYVDLDGLMASSSELLTRSNQLRVVRASLMSDHEKVPFFVSGPNSFYNNSSTMSEVKLVGSDTQYTNGAVTIMRSLCVDNQEYRDLFNMNARDAHIFASSNGRSFPVVLRQAGNKEKTNIRCCRKVGNVLSCLNASTARAKPIIVRFQINNAGNFEGHSIYPKSNDASLGVGFFYYLDQSGGSNNLLKLEYFSIFDPCKSSFGTCDERLKGENSLSNYPAYTHQMFQNISYPIKSSGSFIVQ